MGAQARDGSELRECLCEAGCEDQLVEKCLCLCDDGMPSAARTLLDAHRRELLESLHGTQRKIDRLDHALYELQRTPRS